MQKSLTSNLSSCCVASIDTVYLKHFFCNMRPWFFLWWFWPLRTKCDGLSIVKNHACIVPHSSWILVLHPWSSKYYISTIHWEHIAPHCVSSPMAKIVSAIVIFALPCILNSVTKSPKIMPLVSLKGRSSSKEESQVMEGLNASRKIFKCSNLLRYMGP